MSFGSDGASRSSSKNVLDSIANLAPKDFGDQLKNTKDLTDEQRQSLQGRFTAAYNEKPSKGRGTRLKSLYDEFAATTGEQKKLGENNRKMIQEEFNILSTSTNRRLNNPTTNIQQYFGSDANGLQG